MSENMRKRIVGLIGGMGSGKSRVSQAFARHGATVVSGDKLGHEALEQPEIKARIVDRWGASILGPDGKIDRKKLGAIVFASPVERANLEHLVFPWIEKRILEELDRAQHNPEVPFVVLDAAIMLEAGWNNRCDWVVYIHAPRATRLDRLAHQRGWTAEDVAHREYAQLPLAIKALRADVAIDNSGSEHRTEQQVDHLVRHWNLNRS